MGAMNSAGSISDEAVKEVGWRALVLVGAERIVSRSEWIEEELRRRREPQDVDTSGFRRP